MEHNKLNPFDKTGFSTPNKTVKKTFKKTLGSYTKNPKNTDKTKDTKTTYSNTSKSKSYTPYKRAPNISNVKSEILAFKMVSKTTKGGRRPSISVTILFTSNTTKGKCLITRRKDKNMLNIKAYMSTVTEDMLQDVTLSKNNSISTDLKFNYKGMLVIAKSQKSGKGIKCCDVIRPIFTAANIDSLCVKFKGKKNSTSMIQASELILQKSMQYQSKMMARNIII